MSYATVQQLVDEFGEAEIVELTDRADPPNGTVDATVAQRALDAADQLIDGYLAKRYAVPLASPPLYIATIALDLARAGLYTNAMPQTVADRRKAQVETLKAISRGEITLGVELTPATTVAGLAQVESGDRVFARSARGL